MLDVLSEGFKEAKLKLKGKAVLNESNVKEAIDAIRKTGFDGFYSVEVISKRHRVLPLEEAARRSFETTMAQFAAR